MPLDFPNTPANGQIYSSGSSAWLFDGTKWNPSGTGFLAFIGDTPPTPPPTPGLLWWNSSPGIGQLYVYYNDGTSSQWVAANNMGGGLYLPLTGGTLTGPLVLSGNATAPLNPVTLQQLQAGWLPLTGGTLSGPGNLTVNGTLAVSSAGIQYGASADTFAFTWNGTATNLWHNGTNTGTLVTGGPYLLLTGGTLSGGLHFGSNVAPGGATDTSRHVTLYDTGYGFSITSGTLNIVAGGAAIANFTSSSMTINGTATANGTVTATQVQSTGSSAALQFADRAGTAPTAWVWYATGGTAYLYNTTNGNVVSFDGTGSIYMQRNNVWAVWGKDTGGTARPLIGLMSDNNIYIADGAGRYIIPQGHIIPVPTNTWLCGNSTDAWIQVWSYSYQTASDRRLKTDIEDLPDCLDLVQRIAPQRFRWREGIDTHRTHWGFIAQDIGAVMVDSGHDFGGHTPAKHQTEIDGLDYNEMVSVLWKAVQELTLKVETLSARLA